MTRALIQQALDVQRPSGRVSVVCRIGGCCIGRKAGRAAMTEREKFEAWSKRSLVGTTSAAWAAWQAALASLVPMTEAEIAEWLDALRDLPTREEIRRLVRAVIAAHGGGV